MTDLESSEFLPTRQKEWPVREAARTLHVSVSQVHVNQHRVTALIAAELRRLQREAEADL